jgi:hypothetical protein
MKLKDMPQAHLKWHRKRFCYRITFDESLIQEEHRNFNRLKVIERLRLAIADAVVNIHEIDHELTSRRLVSQN